MFAMRRDSKSSRVGNKRRGAATVEFAIVAPLLFLLVLGMVEFGRMMMVQQILTNGAREGARKAVLPGATDATTFATIDTYMGNAGIQGHTRQVSPDPGAAAAGTPINVTVSVPYKDITWLHVEALGWLENATLTSSVEMRKEEY
jgi:Flp pilus assembly protein TadG